MEKNEFEQNLMRYLDGELSAAEREILEKQFAEAGYSKETLENFSTLHLALQQHPRPEPPEALLNQYHADLKKHFAPESRQDSLKIFLSGIMDTLSGAFSPWFRFAGVAVLIFIGVIAGKLFFTAAPEPSRPENETPVFASPGATGIMLPISRADRERMHRYFLESEILLLQIVNSSEEETIDAEEFEFSREIAEKLLLKTALIREKAIQVNNISALQFTSRMEILLHEIANWDVEEMQNALPLIKQIISDTNLLMEVKTLQGTLKNAQNADLVS